jgi:predicted anti-sigma-YlaC factor YlaD
MMTHAEVKDRFSAYRDGELAPAEAEAVRAHLGECKDCKHDYDEFAQAISSLIRLKSVAPPDFVRSLQGEIRRRSRGRFFSRKPPRFPLEIVSLITLMLMLVVWLYLRVSEPSRVREGAPGGAPAAGKK